MPGSKIRIGESGPIVRPVVLQVKLTPEQANTAFRYTGKLVTTIEFTEEELQVLLRPMERMGKV